MFHCFFQFPRKVEVLILLFAFFQFYSVVRWNNKVHKWEFSLFCYLLCLVVWLRLGDRLYIKIPENFVRLIFLHRFWVVHIFVRIVKINFLHNSQRISLPTQSCLVLYSFGANLLNSPIMWLFVSSLSPHNQHLLFCCFFLLLLLLLLLLFEKGSKISCGWWNLWILPSQIYQVTSSLDCF